jgi:hypothetical protein
MEQDDGEDGYCTQAVNIRSVYSRVRTHVIL